MRALLYDSFGAPPRVANVPDPVVPRDGVVVAVKASGLCRSDWHGWQGHDADIRTLPHIPGHEFAGVIVAAGPDVRRWRTGDRVTTPFVLGCGACVYCLAGDQQVCEKQFQPGFSGPGSFAEYVSLPFADVNLVRLPGEMEFVDAAALGCRIVTAFRGIAKQARLRAGEWVAVYGCGGVGLSAVMIARTLDAKVIGVDVAEGKLALAREAGAAYTFNAADVPDVPESIREITSGGVHVSVDAFGSAITCRNSILSLRPRGRHVQIGLLLGDQAEPALPMGKVIARELEIFGSHGMQAHAYPELLDLIAAGKLPLDKLIGRRIALDDAGAALASLDSSHVKGITVIDRFAA
ncbi:MAG TPA: zinc-dependent alcohol dehydrogenase family protein [Blastocatellia bacterium]|nr:zinc-dependent alcohol dehydrogenase family protein [Blastocatellia bacterium]